MILMNFFMKTRWSKTNFAQMNHDASSQVRPAKGGWQPPLVATPVGHRVRLKKNQKDDKNFNFFNPGFLNILNNSESIETNLFFTKKIFPTTPLHPQGWGGERVGGRLSLGNTQTQPPDMKVRDSIIVN